jgi:hypothetical protein
MSGELYRAAPAEADGQQSLQLATASASVAYVRKADGVADPRIQFGKDVWREAAERASAAAAMPIAECPKAKRSALGSS